MKPCKIEKERGCIPFWTLPITDRLDNPFKMEKERGCILFGTLLITDR
jgi:hypothetical protein